MIDDKEHWESLGTTLQRYKTGNEKTAGHLSVKPIFRFVVSHFYSTFDPQILGSWKGVITRVSKAKAAIPVLSTTAFFWSYLLNF